MIYLHEKHLSKIWTPGTVFERDFMTRVPVPKGLVLVTEWDLRPVTSIFCHRAIAATLPALLAAWRAAFTEHDWRRQGLHLWSGCYHNRLKRGGSTPSVHAYGLAFDQNAAGNPFRHKVTTFDPLVFDIARQFGFFSGWQAWGHDAMHWQAVVPFRSDSLLWPSSKLLLNHDWPLQAKAFLTNFP